MITENEIHRTTSDVYGNPRYIVHFLSIGLDTYEPTEKTRENGLQKYRGKSFGGGFVFQHYGTRKQIAEWLNNSFNLK